jgi:hypothetical protein
VFPESIWLCILPRISNQQTCRSRAASANLPPTVRYSIKICNGMVLKIYLVNNNSTWQELFVVYSMYKLPILSCVHFTKSTLKSHVILLLKTRNSHVILLRESLAVTCRSFALFLQSAFAILHSVHKIKFEKVCAFALEREERKRTTPLMP